MIQGRSRRKAHVPWARWPNDSAVGRVGAPAPFLFRWQKEIDRRGGYPLVASIKLALNLLTIH
jgi:hypothetical protein